MKTEKTMTDAKKWTPDPKPVLYWHMWIKYRGEHYSVGIEGEYALRVVWPLYYETEEEFDSAIEKTIQQVKDENPGKEVWHAWEKLFSSPAHIFSDDEIDWRGKPRKETE